jgi:hypothetical protein
MKWSKLKPGAKTGQTPPKPTNSWGNYTYLPNKTGMDVFIVKLDVDFEEKAAGILDERFDTTQKGDGLPAIDQSMVIA